MQGSDRLSWPGLVGMAMHTWPKTFLSLDGRLFINRQKSSVFG